MQANVCPVPDRLKTTAFRLYNEARKRRRRNVSKESIALKEWAAAIQALETGEQILIMRKGGIIEETRDFELQSHSFFLYPTYEHQKKELFKEPWQALVDRSMANWSPDGQEVDVTCFAEAVCDWEVSSQEELEKLRDFHVWNDTFASERLRWKRTKPLHVILLRVYKLAEPQRIRIKPDYAGCKSWIGLQGVDESAPRTPVLSDDRFAERCEQVRRVLSSE